MYDILQIVKTSEIKATAKKRIIVHPSTMFRNFCGPRRITFAAVINSYYRQSIPQISSVAVAAVLGLTLKLTTPTRPIRNFV